MEGGRISVQRVFSNEKALGRNGWLPFPEKGQDGVASGRNARHVHYRTLANCNSFFWNALEIEFPHEARCAQQDFSSLAGGHDFSWMGQVSSSLSATS
jgi:hypothetical protein